MRFFQKRKNIKFNRIVSAILVAAFLAILPISGSFGYDQIKADTKEELGDAQDDLEKAQETVAELSAKADQTAEEIAEASAALNVILNAQAELQAEIDDMQAQIDQTNEDLDAAEQKRDEEYASMKLRIQFMYENDASSSMWSAVISASSFSEALNRLEYITEVYAADRELMTAYENSVQDVKDLQAQLAEAMSELLAKQETYNEQQESVEASIAILQKKSDEYAAQLADANNQVSEYQNTVNQLAEKVRQEEAAAAKQKAEEYEGGGADDPDAGGGKQAYDDGDEDPPYTGTVTGEELVAYALQFQGNPYVWGGNSLTEGCDCSGFVHLVFAHFGISTPRYSQAFKTVGQEVSYNNMKAGDVVVYPGHVAIYIGNGCIVEAQSTKAGITANRSVDCHTITAIRRLL